MNNQHEVLINAVELASELASADLESNFGDSMNLYKEEDDETTYTEQAQDMFDELYDHYMSIIESTKVK
jgi:hypothetical protein